VAGLAAPDSKQPGSGVLYGVMNRKHVEYDALFWERLRLLKAGGYEILKHAHLFVPKYPAEREEVYRFRLKQASYIGLLGKVCGYLVGSLFLESLTVGPPTEAKGEEPKFPDADFYKKFFEDCDLEDTDYSQFLRNAVYEALIYRRALIGIDLPEASAVPPETKAEEDALDLSRAWLYRIDLSSLINWHSVPRVTKGPIKGTEFVWAILKGEERDRSNPLGGHDEYRETFKIWRMINGVAHFERWRTRVLTEKDPPKDDDELEQVSELTATSFRAIPIEELRLPEELWVGHAAGPMCEEHFRDRSMLKGDMARSLHEVGYVKQGPEIPAVHGALPSHVQQNPNRGAEAQKAVTSNGWVVIGSGDELGFAGPSGRAHALVVEWLDKVKEEVQGVVNTMALSISNTGAALQRSGDSKREDRSATTIILQALATCTKEAAKRVMRHVSEARNETVEWTSSGLNTFDKTERTELVNEGVQMETVSIPSPTWKRAYYTQLAHATLPNATPEEKRMIADEIANNVTNEQVSMDPIERARQMAAAEGGFEAGGGGGDEPPGKPAGGKPGFGKKPAPKAK
jgi:hypothetical protein